VTRFSRANRRAFVVFSHTAIKVVNRTRCEFREKCISVQDELSEWQEKNGRFGNPEAAFLIKMINRFAGSVYSSLQQHAIQVSLHAHCPPESQLHEFSSQTQSTQVHASPQHTQSAESELAEEIDIAGIAIAKAKMARPAINLVIIENPTQ